MMGGLSEAVVDGLVAVGEGMVALLVVEVTVEGLAGSE